MYEQDLTLQEKSKKGTGFAVASLVLGILCILCCCLWYVSLIFGGLSIAFAIVNKKQAGHMDSIAVAGLICGIVGVVVALLLFISSLAIQITNPGYVDNLLNEFYNGMEAGGATGL